MIGNMEMAIASIVTIVAIIMIIRIIFGNKGMVYMALRKFEINTDPAAEYIIIIEGRKTGLWAWLLVKLNLGNIYQLKVRKEDIRYLAESLAGKSLSLIPLHKISSTSCGYEKPVWWIIWGVIFVIISPFTLFFSLIFAAICFVAYIYKKNFFVLIETTGSSNFGFAFKRSFIENESIDIKQIETCITIINDMIKTNKQ